jgi:CRP-like cAMP-binding protein
MDGMPSRNLLLAAFPTEVRDRLAKRWKIVDLKRGEILHHPCEKIEVLYFPLDCLISVTILLADGGTAEAGIVTSHDMAGLNAVIGESKTNHTQYICQVRGSAVHIAAETLRHEFNTDAHARDVVLRFAQAYIAQLSQNAVCNSVHSIEQRLCRWILDCRIRLQTDELQMTHDYIAAMLGVRRASVSESAKKLQERGLIKTNRGCLSVLDANGLGKMSCECFEVVRREYQRFFAHAFPSFNKPGKMS